MSKHAGGRPPKYKKAFHNKDFIEQSRKGKVIIQIASSWEVHRDTLYAWAKKYPEFSDTLHRGQQLCQSYWIDLGYADMVGAQKPNGDKIKIKEGMYKWLTTNLFKWSYNQEIKTEQNVKTTGTITYTTKFDLPDEDDGSKN